MNLRNTLLLLCLVCIGFSTLNAQEIKFPKLDPSPMDAVHYPRQAAYRNYLEGDDRQMAEKIKVLYCRPLKKDREIFGKLVPYGQDWRLGANEATEVTFYQDVEIGGTFVSRGTYTMFAEVYPDQWIMKISTERNIGGAQNRDVTKDIAMVAVPVSYVPESRESFTVGFQKIDDNACNMVFSWDRTMVKMPVSFNPVYMAGDDKSPMDLAQYPNMSRLRNFVKPEELDANKPQVRVTYGRPQMKGRVIFGDLLKYGEMWRLGANETTEITFYEKVKVGDTEIKPGKYGIMARVHKDKWEFIIHTDIPSWGHFGHDDATNVATISVPVEKSPAKVEALSILFDKKDEKNVHMIVAWDQVMARLPIQLMGK